MYPQEDGHNARNTTLWAWVRVSPSGNGISLEHVFVKEAKFVMFALYQFPASRQKHLLTSYLPDEEQVQEK